MAMLRTPGIIDDIKVRISHIRSTVQGYDDNKSETRKHADWGKYTGGWITLDAADIKKLRELSTQLERYPDRFLAESEALAVINILIHSTVKQGTPSYNELQTLRCKFPPGIVEAAQILDIKGLLDVWFPMLYRHAKLASHFVMWEGVLGILKIETVPHIDILLQTPFQENFASFIRAIRTKKMEFDLNKYMGDLLLNAKYTNAISVLTAFSDPLQELGLKSAIQHAASLSFIAQYLQRHMQAEAEACMKKIIASPRSIEGVKKIIEFLQTTNISLTSARFDAILERAGQAGRIIAAMNYIDGFVPNVEFGDLFDLVVQSPDQVLEVKFEWMAQQIKAKATAAAAATSQGGLFSLKTSQHPALQRDGAASSPPAPSPADRTQPAPSAFSS